MPAELKWPVLGAFCLGLLAATLAGAWWRARREGRALADRLAFHEAILERIPYAVYVKDGQGRFTSCNRAYELMVGVSRVALQGQTSLALPHVSSAERKRLDEEESAVLQQVEGRECELPITHADGNARIMRCSINALGLGAPSGGLVGVFVEVPDVRRQPEPPPTRVLVPTPVDLVDRSALRLALERLRVALSHLDPSASADALDDLRVAQVPQPMEGDFARLYELVKAYEYADAGALATRLLERIPAPPRG